MSCIWDEYELHNKKDIRKMEQKIEDTGYYPYRCDEDRVKELSEEKKELDNLFDELMQKRIKKWLDLATSEIKDENIRIIINPGNDDRFSVDHIISEHERVIYPLQKVVCLDDKREMVSCEWVNFTPWNSPRECSEKELMKKLEVEIARLDHVENAVFNFHSPPYNTAIDQAPKLDKNLKPVTFLGRPQIENVGSKSVREVIQRYQPLMGLHGHIHESPGEQRIGKTICLNPGSDYSSGILHFFLMILNEKIRYWHREI